VDRLSGRLREAAPGLEVIRHASMFWIRRASAEPVRRPDRIPADHGEWFRRFFHHALEGGVYLPPSGYEVCFLSMAHDEATLAAAADVLVEAARKATRG